MKNDERIIKYLEGELQEEEKALFEKDLSDSEVLRNELAAYKKVITAFDEQKSFDTDKTYFNNLVPATRKKLEQRETINPFRKLGYAAAFILIFIAGYFIFQPLFLSSSENILTIEELADSMTDAELGEMIDYLVEDDETEFIDENIYNIEEVDLENIIIASTYETKLAIISDFGINNFLVDITETEKEKIYNELINKNFSSEVNL
jgi:hypothetical protein